MRHFLIQEAALASLARLEDILSVAGAHAWSPAAIAGHMKAEAKKLRPNRWYYVARAVPSKEPNLGNRLEFAFMCIFFGGLIEALFGVCCAVILGVISHVFDTANYAYVGGVLFILGIAVAAGVFFNNGINRIWVISPGKWKTEKYSNFDRLHTHPAAKQLVRNICTMIPDSQFEVSLLYQDRELCDPVLWLVLPGNAGRRAILVWDEKGNVILPH
jgi:hypothetical protein